GDRVLVANCGRFGDLFADLASRYGALVTQVTAEWGKVVDPQQIDEALKRTNAKIVAAVHGETSTGMLQPMMDEIGRICRRHDALRLIVDEGLEPRWGRHQRAGDALKAGLEAMGIQLFGDTKHRLPMITAMMIPEGVPDEEGRNRLLEEFGVEVATSFGPLRGRIWRIGTMGYNAELRTVLTVLTALEHVLRPFYARVPRGAGVEEARRV